MTSRDVGQVPSFRRRDIAIKRREAPGSRARLGQGAAFDHAVGDRATMRDSGRSLCRGWCEAILDRVTW
jgi:hypothetical protein